MVTQEMIEDAVVKYVLDHATKPRFVLLDIASYEKFSDAFTPVESVEYKNNKEAFEEPPKIARLHSSANCSVDILAVRSDKPLFEVVG